jgi:hypothetical protein
MTTITRQTLKDIKEALTPQLESLGKQLGVDLKFGSGQYGATGYLKVEIAPISSDGHTVTAEARSFPLFCAAAGLEPEDLWGTFRTRSGDEYQIVGYNTRAPKMPILCKKTSDGRSYKFSADTFRHNPPVITREAPTV